jgi:hypothetical protein
MAKLAWQYFPSEKHCQASSQRETRLPSEVETVEACSGFALSDRRSCQLLGLSGGPTTDSVFHLSSARRTASRSGGPGGGGMSEVAGLPTSAK